MRLPHNNQVCHHNDNAEDNPTVDKTNIRSPAVVLIIMMHPMKATGITVVQMISNAVMVVRMVPTLVIVVQIVHTSVMMDLISAQMVLSEVMMA